MPATTADKPYDPAAWMHQRLVHQVMEFEKNLGPDHEVGGRFVEGPNGEPLHLSNVASWGPDMILFMGEFPDGRKWELVQHYSQVSMLLVAVKKINDAPRRIGFELLKSVRSRTRRGKTPSVETSEGGVIVSHDGWSSRPHRRMLAVAHTPRAARSAAAHP